MPRKVVIEVACTRCQRVEYREQDAQVLSCTLLLEEGGEPVLSRDYPELCRPCWNTLKNQVELLTKEFKGRSPRRQDKVASEKAVAPSKATV